MLPVVKEQIKIQDVKKWAGIIGTSILGIVALMAMFNIDSQNPPEQQKDSVNDITKKALWKISLPFIGLISFGVLAVIVVTGYFLYNKFWRE